METGGDGTRTRTVVVSGVPDALPVDRMADKLTIHFQSCRRSRGGDVEEVEYPTSMQGVAFVTFDRAEDAERVVRKERHIMADPEFPAYYRLTVFPFTRDVLLYVPSATVDLSAFSEDQLTLIRSLRSAHRSLHFQSSHKRTKVTVEGPFSAVQALRQDLIRRAGRLKPAEVPARAAAELRETPLKPSVISHREVVGSASCGGSKAEPGPGSSHCLSPPPPTTGEATEVQSPLSNGKTRSASPRQKVSHESLEEKPRERSRQEMPAEYRTELSEADPKQVLNAEVRGSSSDLDLDRAEAVSATKPGVDGAPEKRTRPDRMSAPKIRAENPSTDYLEDPDQSGSAFAAETLRTKDVSTSSKSDTGYADGLPATGPGDEGEACVWVDSDTFRYIEKFDKAEFDGCLRGLEARVQLEGGELARISLTERQTSKTGSGVWRASEELKSLVEFRSQMLRVHRLDLDEERQTLIKICDDVSVLYTDVLYLLEDSCVKVIGPSIPAYLFCRRVEDKVARLKDAVRT